MAGQVGLSDHLNIGHRAILGAKAGLMNDVPDDAVFIGVPATPERDQWRMWGHVRQLPNMRRQLKKLQQQLDQATASPAPPQSAGRCLTGDCRSVRRCDPILAETDWTTRSGSSSAMNSARRMGLIAGWGNFPLAVARALKRQGYEVYCLGIRDHADPELARICDDFRLVGIAKLGSHIRYFRRRRGAPGHDGRQDLQSQECCSIAGVGCVICPTGDAAARSIPISSHVRRTARTTRC